MSDIKEAYVHPTDGRVTAIAAAQPDTSLSEHEQDQSIAGTFPARPGAQDDAIAPAGMSATGGLPSTGPADQGVLAPQSATATHGVTGIGYPGAGTAQKGTSVSSGLAESERSVGGETAGSESLQDAALDGTHAARPGGQEITPVGPQSGNDGRPPAVSNTAHIGAVSAVSSTAGSTTLPEREQDANLAGSFASRPGAQDAAPAGLSDTSLTEREQDANLAGSFASRPGAKDAPPAGLSGTTHQGTPEVNNSALPDSVKSSLDSVADTAAPKSVADQLPTASSINEQLPTTQQATQAAQHAAESVARGASSLLAGISNLALGARNATSETAAQPHPESEKASDVDDLHIPGAFEAETSDRDDINAMKENLPSTEQISRNLPDANTARVNITGSERPLVDQASDAARSAQESISGQIPDANTARANVTGSERPIIDQAQDATTSAQEQISEQVPDANTARANATGSERPIVDQASDAMSRQTPDADTARANTIGSERPIVDQARDATRSASNQIPDANTARANVTGSERPLVDQASDAAHSAQVQAQQGLDYAKEQVFGQTPANKVTHSRTDSALNAPASSPAQVPSDTTSSAVDSGLPSGTSTIDQTQPTVTTGIASAEAPMVSVKDGPEAREVPDMVADSYRKAGETAPLDLPAYDAGEEQHKLAALDQNTTGSVDSTGQSSSGAGVGGAIAGGLAAAGTAIAGAAEYARHQTHQVTGTDPVTILPESAQKMIDPQTAANTSDASLQRGEAPEVVQHSQIVAGVDPEASANPFAVQDKNDVEAELKREVQPAQASSENNTVTGVATGPLASAGAAAANTARSAQEEMSQQIPDANTARANVTGSERPIIDQAQDGATHARESVQQVVADPVSVLSVSAQQTIGHNTTTGSIGQDYPSVLQSHQNESYLNSSSGPEPGTGVVPVDGGAVGQSSSAVPSTLQTESHLTSSSGPEPGTGDVPLIVAADAGTTSGIPRDAVESSAAPDVSYENRPKTLPLSEIAAREQERGLGEGNTSAHEPIEFQPVIGTPSPGNVDLYPGVHNGVVGVGSAQPLDLVNVDLHSGVHNGVVGAGSAHPLGDASILSHATSTKPREGAVVEHISDDLEHVDLSKGVRNGVVGAGAGASAL